LIAENLPGKVVEFVFAGNWQQRTNTIPGDDAKNARLIVYRGFKLLLNDPLVWTPGDMITNEAHC